MGLCFLGLWDKRIKYTCCLFASDESHTISMMVWLALTCLHDFYMTYPIGQYGLYHELHYSLPLWGNYSLTYVSGVTQKVNLD